jgi:hypothetical protein
VVIKIEIPMKTFPANEPDAKRVVNFCQRFGLAAGLMVLLTGCATVEKYSLTYRLWDNSDLRKFSEPAPDPNLALFDATNRADVLVQYDALSEKRSTVKRRAYYLQSNQSRIAEGKKPKFVKPALADGMRSIPVLTPPSATNPPPQLTAYAVSGKEGRAFTLHRQTGSPARFELPVYCENSGTVAQVVLTPFALVGDTAMVGVALAFVGFLIWVQSGAPTH